MPVESDHFSQIPSALVHSAYLPSILFVQRSVTRPLPRGTHKKRQGDEPVKGI